MSEKKAEDNMFLSVHTTLVYFPIDNKQVQSVEDIKHFVSDFRYLCSKCKSNLPFIYFGIYNLFTISNHLLGKPSQEKNGNILVICQ